MTRWTGRQGAMTTVVGFLLVVAFSGPLWGVNYLFGSAFLGLFLGAMWRLQAPDVITLPLAVMVKTAALLSQIGLFSVYFGTNVLLAIITVFRDKVLVKVLKTPMIPMWKATLAVVFVFSASALYNVAILSVIKKSTTGLWRRHKEIPEWIR